MTSRVDAYEQTKHHDVVERSPILESEDAEMIVQGVGERDVEHLP